MTVNSFQKGERLIVLALCSVNRKFLYFLYHKKIFLCSALPCFFTSSSSPHKIATLQEQTLWKPKVINSALWHSFTPLLWCQNLFSLSVLISNAECFLEDTHFSHSHFSFPSSFVVNNYWGRNHKFLRN